MAKHDYSNHQKKVINQYYNQLDTIMLQKLQELVSELYLADSEAKRKRLWERAGKAMINLKVPPQIVEHIMAKRDVQVLAKNLQDWIAQSSRKK